MGILAGAKMEHANRRVDPSFIEDGAVLERQQKRRKRFAILAGMTHSFNVLVLALIHLQDWVSLGALIYFLVVAALGVGVFYFAVATGWSRKRSDPSLTFEQLIFATTLGLTTIAMITHPLGRAVFSLFGMVAIVYSANGLPRRRLLAAMCIMNLQCLLMTLWVLRYSNDPDYVRQTWITYVVMLLGAIQMLAFGSVVASMREKIRERTAALRMALDELHRSNRDLTQERDVASTLAARDELTGLANRRQLMAQLELLAQRSDRGGQPLSIAFFDLDHFKRINDSCGHVAGDHVLKGVAERISGVVRSNDLFGRFGGEEFLLLMPGTEMEGAMALCERIRFAIADMPFEIPSGGTIGGHNGVISGANGSIGGPNGPASQTADVVDRTLYVSLSGGVALREGGESVDSLIARSDSALYLAKQWGRNRVVAAPSLGAVAA